MSIYCKNDFALLAVLSKYERRQAVSRIKKDLLLEKFKISLIKNIY